jgi:hypothetical protein
MRMLHITFGIRAPSLCPDFRALPSITHNGAGMDREISYSSTKSRGRPRTQSEQTRREFCTQVWQFNEVAAIMSHVQTVVHFVLLHGDWRTTLLFRNAEPGPGKLYWKILREAKFARKSADNGLRIRADGDRGKTLQESSGVIFRRTCGPVMDEQANNPRSEAA